MTNPSVSINPVYRTGYVDLLFNLSNPPGEIARLVVITNDNRSTAETPPGTGMVETDRPHLDSSGLPVTKVVLSSAMAPAGKLVFVTLQVYFDDAANTVISSQTTTVISRNIPQEPSDNNLIIREDDKGLSINIGYAYPEVMGTADGYSKITKAIVYISKVGGTSPSDFITKEVAIGDYLDSSGKPTYNSILKIDVELFNSVAYEVAFRVVNSLGQSALSKTYIKTPKDFPATLDAPVVFTLFGNQSRLNQTLVDPSGSVVVYFRRPSDYDELISSGTPVQKYIVNEYFGTNYNSVNTYDLLMNASGVPTSTNANWSITTATDYFYNSIDDSGYHYKFTINGSPSRLGITYKYKIIAVNVNGQSPESAESIKSIKTFLLPSAQTTANCELLHTQVDGAAANNGLAYKKHTGDMTMRISALSNTNSGNDYIDTNSNPIYKLNVTDLSNNSILYSDEVTFIRSSSVYNLDFNNVIKVIDTVNYSLNQLLVKGTKYKFELRRLSISPNDSTIKLESSALRIDRTPFSSPGKIKFCESYAYTTDVNSNLIPVTTPGGNKAIRVLFGRLLPEELNACGLTSVLTGEESLYEPGNNKFAAIRYIAFQNSQVVYVTSTGEYTDVSSNPVLSVSHYPVTTDPYMLTVPIQSYGQLTANYIRVQIYNRELGTYIHADESSPAVSEKALSYVGPVTGLTVTKTSETSITVTYTRQANISLNGNAEADTSNRVIVVKDSTNYIEIDTVVPYTSTALVATQSVSVTGLFNGDLYRVYVVAETYYRRRKYNSVDAEGLPNDSQLLFENVVIRSSSGVATTNVQMTGIPTAPTSIELFSTDSTITAYYDAPTNTYGVTNLRYHIYTWDQDLPARPSFSIANLTGTQEITITKGALLNETSAAAASLLSKTRTYSVAMQVIGEIGNVNIENTSYIHTYDDGKINNVVVNNYMTLLSPIINIPSSVVNGLVSSSQSIVIHDAITAPPNTQVRSSEGTLVVSFDKLTPMTDLVISVDESDAVNYDDSPVASFDTRALRTLFPTGGLYFLEEYTYTYTAAQKNALTEAQKNLIATFDKYKFERLNVAGTFRFFITFSGLKNALPYKFSARYCKKFDTYDAFSQASVITGSAEAAPSLPRFPKFSVDSNTIIAQWSPPSSKGSETAVLKYTVTIKDSQGNENTLPTINAEAGESPATVYTSTISSLTNGASYTVFVNAFYNKLDGTPVTGNPVSINVNGAIIPRAKPLGATLSASFGSNRITAFITPPIGDERANYPLTTNDGLILSVRRFGVTGSKQTVKTWTNDEYLNATTDLSYNVTSFSAGPISHSKPLNAFNYEFILEYAVNYTYAQPISSSSVAITPSGSATIVSANVIDLGRKISVQVNLNGSGAINNIVGLAKTSASNAIVVRNLSSGSFPLDFITGGNATADTHSGQIATFTLDYTALGSSISDHLTVITTTNSSDTFVGSSGSNFFT